MRNPVPLLSVHLQTYCGVEFEIFKPLLSDFPVLVGSLADCFPFFVPRFVSAVFNFFVEDSKDKCFWFVECRSVLPNL